MMNLEALNRYLFDALERTNTLDVKDEHAQMELNRAKAMVEVSDTIIGIARLSLEAEEFKHSVTSGGGKAPTLPLIGSGDAQT